LEVSERSQLAVEDSLIGFGLNGSNHLVRNTADKSDGSSKGYNEVKNQNENQRGFSLIEMMIASAVLLIGVLSVASLIGYSISADFSSKNNTIATAAAERQMEQLRSSAFNSLVDGGSILNSSGSITFAGSPVAGYSSTVTLADSDQIGKTVSYDVRWNIVTVNGLKKITVAAQRSGGTFRLQQAPAQLIMIKTP
jgi:prepilin-type N-terminal cleavage/methylation domain-containing protein